MDLRKLTAIQQKYEVSLLSKANVVSVGCGCRHKHGEKTDEDCLVVGVSKKIDKGKLQEDDFVPATLDGTVVDVYEVGLIKAGFDPKQKHRPAVPGTSIGHKNITAGTFGCVVLKDGERFILSNNHVLANTNEGVKGDEIWQPGSADGGSTADRIGFLEDFVPIQFGGGGGVPPVEPPTCPIAKGAAGTANLAAKLLRRKHRLVAVRQAEDNFVDAALAFPTDEIVDEIHQIGKPKGVAAAAVGLQVQKYGRTTEYTTGEVLQSNATVNVQYGAGQIATFREQFVTGPMSAGGDSGSAVLDMNGNIVGLLFAGSNATMIFSPIQKVFDLLNVTLA